MKAYKCDICGKLYEKDEKIERQRIELTLRIGSVTRVKMDVCSACYEYFTKYIGMENKAYFPEKEDEEADNG